MATLHFWLTLRAHRFQGGMPVADVAMPTLAAFLPIIRALYQQFMAGYVSLSQLNGYASLSQLNILWTNYAIII